MTMPDDMFPRVSVKRGRRSSRIATLVLIVTLILACNLPISLSTTEPDPTPESSNTPVVTREEETIAPPETPVPETPTAQPTDLPLPDKILFNGTVITLDADRPGAEAIAVSGDTIVAVGSQEEAMALAGESTTLVDLQGNTVLPGFIDSHSHWIGDRALGGFEEAEEVVQHVVSLGWTSINELFVDQGRLDELIALDQAGLLPLRVNAYLPVNFTEDKFGDWYLVYPPGGELSPHVRIAGIKLFMDHGWGEDVHWTQEELNTYVAQAHENGFQIAAHTVGHESLDLLLGAIDAALMAMPDPDPRFRIEHAIQVRDDQLLPILEKGALASVQFPGPADFPRDPEFNQRLAVQPLDWLMRWRDFVDIGIPTTGSTDWPWTTPEGYHNIPLTPFLAAYMAVTRDGYFHLEVAPYQVAQTLTIEQALDLLTLQGAYGTFEEARKGSLAVGKWADLVVLSANPMEIPLTQLPEIEVLLTMVGGQVVFDRGGLGGD